MRNVPQELLDDTHTKWGFSAFTPPGYVSGRTGDGREWCFKSPYGVSGDQLWVREPWWVPPEFDKFSGSQIAQRCIDAGYERPWVPTQFFDGKRVNWDRVSFGDEIGRYRHARFMPEVFARTLLEVKSVHIERLLEITDAGAIAEGVHCYKDGLYKIYTPTTSFGTTSPRRSFLSLWDAINGIGSSDQNPAVFVIKFRRIV